MPHIFNNLYKYSKTPLRPSVCPVFGLFVCFFFGIWGFFCFVFLFLLFSCFNNRAKPNGVM